MNIFENILGEFILLARN